MCGIADRQPSGAAGSPWASRSTRIAAAAYAMGNRLAAMRVRIFRSRSYGLASADLLVTIRRARA
jgi:hypothetical protein